MRISREGSKGAKGRTDGKRTGPGGLRSAAERCPCGELATHYSGGPRCEKCRVIEERLGCNYAKSRCGVPGYYRDPYKVQVPNQGWAIQLSL
jgi:hypothetical protein